MAIPGVDGYFDEHVAATFDDDYDYQAEAAVAMFTSESRKHVSVWEKPS